MKHRVPLSALGGVSPEDFADVVQTHATNLREHRDHHDLIAAGEERQPYPEPYSLPMVAACISEDLTPDYEIVDDTPPPPTADELLRAHKDELIAQIMQWEQQEIEPHLLPPGARRLHGMLVGEGNAGAVARQREIDAATAPIQRRGAELCAEVEGLTEKNIEGWSWKSKI